jgi:hypothetical protein
MTHDRRRQLIALLDAYPIEREAYLYDGRRQTHPREEMADKVEELFKPTLFQKVMESSKTLVERFGGELTQGGVLGKYAEERQEFLEAIYNVIDAESESLPLSMRLKTPRQLRQEATREFIDMVVTAGGIMSYLGITWEDIQDATTHVIAKNEAKTTDTHEWDDQSKTVLRKNKKVQE